MLPIVGKNVCPSFRSRLVVLFLVSPLGFVLSLSPQDIPQTPLGSLDAEQIGFPCSIREVRQTCSLFDTLGSKIHICYRPVTDQNFVYKLFSA